MNSQIADLVARIRSLEAELESEVARHGDELRFRIENRRVVFEREAIRLHREMKTRLVRYLVEARPLSVITAPVIYALIVPLVLLDAAVTIYQSICFPAYGIPRVRRRDYLVFDRHNLAYLNAIEKLNCAYCSYANGLFAYAREIGARTELYWCPIKHARRVFGAHPHYGRFVDFGDADAYRGYLERLKRGVEIDEAG